MDHLSSGSHKQFKSLFDIIAANPIVSANESALGPSVGDDGTAPALTVLGTCVGDDEAKSDIRLKEDVRCVGSTVFGLPLYQFRYLGEPETYEGVMAQEVLKVMPGAVSVGADGFHRVNYDALGISMQRVS
jgi:hypothetical protein